MFAFIVRPFGEKTHASEAGSREVNFNEIEEKLIGPALAKEGIHGRTTMDIVHAGDIRADMFHRLLTADVVIADLSMHNANVFYELGIRHALRKSNTVLISGELDDHVFDLGPDRYMPYSVDDPGKSVEELAKRIHRTLRNPETDSPVFRMNEGLKEPAVSDFTIVPARFLMDVGTAVSKRDAPLLALMAEEIGGLSWAREGQRVVARSQRKIEDFKGAAATWEHIRREVEGDVEANIELSTVYDRLHQPKKNQQALDWALGVVSKRAEEAETEALIARNAKTVWRHEWEVGEGIEERQKLALESPYLGESAKRYERGFLRDLNHFYSGINTLALYRVRQELARKHPDSWQGFFDSTEKAKQALEELDQKVETLSHAVDQSLQAAATLEDPNNPDVWRIITVADYHFLTSENQNYVKNQYKQAKLACGRIKEDDQFAVTSAARQLQMYVELGVLADSAKAGIDALGVPSEEKEEEKGYGRVLVFAGHQIDPPGKRNRFPNECELKARAAISDKVQILLQSTQPGKIVGFAGAASGGDILFHEICGELGVETNVLVGLSENNHIVEAVTPAGPAWVERYRNLAADRKPRFLSETDSLPTWIDEREDYNPLLRTSAWIIKTANSVPATHYSLIALWDEGDVTGTGGTADMVQLGKSHGFAVEVINTHELFHEELQSA